MNIPLLVGGLVIIGISLAVRASQAATKNVLVEEEEDPEPAEEQVFLSPPAGFRRAKNSEVTPQIQAKASAMLSQPLGTLHGPFTNENGVQYFIAVESHSNAKKGSSVFIQK